MKKKNWTLALAGGAAMTLGVAAAFAHGGATGIVKERMDAMAAMGEAVKTVSAMFKKEQAYDADVVREAAETIKSHAGEAMTALFPEGSGGMPSEALPAVWSDWETFGDLAERLELFSTALAGVADKGPGTDGAGATSQGKDMMGTQSMMGTDAMMGTDQGAETDAMMGTGAMMGTESAMEEASPMPSLEMLAKMSAEGVFTKLVQTCSSCHTDFRSEAE